MKNTHFHPVPTHHHFQENFLSRSELGASVSVWKENTEILNLAEGFEDREKTIPWSSQTPALVWSATKGVSAACTLHALHASSIPLDTEVRHLWPKFAEAGKQSITIRMILQHQCGLSALDIPAPVEDRSAVLNSIEKQTPSWQPGTAHGYHPRTFGFLVDEIVRRATGTTIGQYWRTIFGDPMSLEFWIGLPEELLKRAAPVFSPRTTLPKDDPFLAAFMTPGSLTSRSFASPKGLHSASAMNEDAPRMAEYPGWGGIGTASALAKFYAMLATDGCFQGTRLFPHETLEAIRNTRVQGEDRILQIETCFSLGFMRDPIRPDGSKLRSIFGPSPEAFGHPGAGGSVAFADPETGIGCAYIMNQMEPGVLPNLKSSGLWQAFFTGSAS